MGRDLTDAEIRDLADRKWCPFCHSMEFHEGPAGGMAQNMYCARCSAGYNLTPFRGFGWELIKEPDETLPKTWEAVWGRRSRQPVAKRRLLDRLRRRS